MYVGAYKLVVRRCNLIRCVWTGVCCCSSVLCLARGSSWRTVVIINGRRSCSCLAALHVLMTTLAVVLAASHSMCCCASGVCLRCFCRQMFGCSAPVAAALFSSSEARVVEAAGAGCCSGAVATQWTRAACCSVKWVLCIPESWCRWLHSEGEPVWSGECPYSDHVQNSSYGLMGG